MDGPIYVETKNGYHLEIKTQNMRHSRFYNNRRQLGRLYIHHTGETKLLDMIINRKFRPADLYKKEIIPAIKKVLKDTLDNGVTFQWSQKAGCSCPCSPGFIVKSYKYPIKDIWVTVSDFPNTVEE